MNRPENAMFHALANIEQRELAARRAMRPEPRYPFTLSQLRAAMAALPAHWKAGATRREQLDYAVESLIEDSRVDPDVEARRGLAWARVRGGR